MSDRISGATSGHGHGSSGHPPCAPRQQCARDRLVGLVFGEPRGGVVLDVPQHALQDAADGPRGRSFAVEANDLGHEVEASLDGATYIAGGDGVFPARVQCGKEVEARIAGERSGIDRQPRFSRVIGSGPEDVPLAKIPVQEAIPWFGEDLAQRCRALDEQRTLLFWQGPPQRRLDANEKVGADI